MNIDLIKKGVVTMTKKNQKTKSKYSQNLAQLYAWLSFVCFGIVVLEPLWRYNYDTVSASIYVLVGWIAAILSTRIEK